MYTVRIKNKREWNEVVIENVLRVYVSNERNLLYIICPYNTIDEYKINLNTVEYCSLFDNLNRVVWGYTYA